MNVAAHTYGSLLDTHLRCVYLVPLSLADTVPPYSWAVLVCLLLVYISNQWTRNILPYVVNFNVADTAES